LRNWGLVLMGVVPEGRSIRWFLGKYCSLGEVGLVYICVES
jgi:hypothetical protein